MPEIVKKLSFFNLSENLIGTLTDFLLIFLAILCEGGCGYFSGKSGIVMDEVKQMAKDRTKWREMILHKRRFVGVGHAND